MGFAARQHQVAAGRRPSTGWTLALTSLATFMVALDALVVITALPSIQHDLHASVSTLQWTINAYGLTWAAGIITAAALGDALQVPVHGVCTLDAIAHEAGPGGPLLVVTDARRREVYWAGYDGRRLAGPEVVAPAVLAERAGQFERAAGEAAARYADLLGLPVVAPEYPSPTGLVAVAAADVLARATPAEFRPLYLRRPDAVEPGARKKVGT